MSVVGTAVVTGAGSPRGIGRATAMRLARDGWAIVAADIDGAAAMQSATAVAQAHCVPTLAVPCDVAQEDSVAALHQAVTSSDLPPVGVVATIAGITAPQDFVDSTRADWDHVVAVNATGTYLVVKAFVDDLIAQRFGRIITMGSVTAQHGGGVFSKTLYAGAKAAIIGLTRGLARELAPYGITANCVSPGAVDTDIRGDATTPERELELSHSVPLGRQASVEDVAAAFAYFAGSDGSYLTGVTLPVNGGSYIC
ncbi:MAG: SDR family NAD(P)-dependent oxidoreductase [Beutenbergiaceae bacterium]